MPEVTAIAGARLPTFLTDSATRIPLYTHRPVRTDSGEVIAEPGKVMVHYRVGNVEALATVEWLYFNNKAVSARFLPWPPGEECLKRPYPPLPGDRLTTGAPARGRPMGCPECREAASRVGEQEVPDDDPLRAFARLPDPTVRPRAAAAEVQAPSVESASIASVAPPKVEADYKCPVCNYRVPEHTRSGKRYPPSNRRQVLKRHLGTHTTH